MMILDCGLLFWATLYRFSKADPEVHRVSMNQFVNWGYLK